MTENIVMPENFPPNWMKDMNINIQKAQQTPRKMNSNTHYNRTSER